MKPTIRLAWSILAFGALSLTACSSQGETPENGEVPVVVEDFSVIAEGQLVPLSYVDLAFASGGRVSEILAEEGQALQSGEVIATLSNREGAQAQVAAARLELISAQQALDVLFREAELRRGQAELDLANAREELEDTEYRRRVQQPGNRANGEVIAAEESNLVLAEEEVKSAEKAYNRVSGRKDTDPAKALARSNLAAARQHRDSILRRLNWYRGEPSDNEQIIFDAEVAIAQANVTLAENEWEAWKDGPDPDELALAEARLANAEAQLSAAEAALAETELRAPIAGILAELALKVGEQVPPGQRVAVVADFSGWMIETRNLTEIEVPRVAVGQPVVVTFDALPELSLDGSVVSISPLFREIAGDITYAVEIGLEELDPRLQWGMTSVVTFEEGG